MKLLLLTAILANASCSKKIDNLPVDIDLALINLLEETPDGLAHFKLPREGDLSGIPNDTRNPLTIEKIELGKMLFHETGMAQNTLDSNLMSTYSCATCHHAQAGFQSGLKQGIAEGGMGFGVAGEGRVRDSRMDVKNIDVQSIKTPTVLNVAYQSNMGWNGEVGSKGQNINTEHLWSKGQTSEINHLGYEGVESQSILELTRHRMGMDTAMLHDVYSELFDKSFGNLPKEDRISMTTIAMAISAYQRSLLPNQAPFQTWLNGDYSAMSNDQIRGALLFFGKAQCNSCHDGPALNSMNFHALGFDDLTGVGVLNSNVDDNIHLGRGGFTKRDAELYSFKVPQLYNLKDARYFGHGASFLSIGEIIHYKNNGQKQNHKVASRHIEDQFKPLHLTDIEVDQLTDFIENGLYDSNLSRYTPIQLPSGNCFPNADELSKIDLNCN